MTYIVRIPLDVGVEVTERTCALARATLSVEMGRPVEGVTYRGSVYDDQDPLVMWHTFAEKETSR